MIVVNAAKTPKIFIPNVFANWPWPRRLNPHYAVVKKEADTWFKSFKPFSPRSQNVYNRCDINLLACLAQATAIKEHARLGCDLHHFLFMFDDHSDWFTQAKTREQKDVIMDAFRNPHKPRPKGEWIIGEVARQFWERTVPHAAVVTQKRFIEAVEDYLDSVVREKANQEEGRILDVNSYLDLRRRTGAVRCTFGLLELGLDIPEEVMSHPAITRMTTAANDMVILTNDMVSYNQEQRRGDSHQNIITSIMDEYHTDVNGAMLWLADFLARAQETFITSLAALPEWEEPLNSQVKEYCDGMGQWVRANYDWSFEGERYFGSEGHKIKEKRWMSLLPKKNAVEVGPMHIEGSLL